MNSKIVLFGLLIIVIIGSGYFLYTKNTNNESLEKSVRDTDTLNKKTEETAKEIKSKDANKLRSIIISNLNKLTISIPEILKYSTINENEKILSRSTFISTENGELIIQVTSPIPGKDSPPGKVIEEGTINSSLGEINFLVEVGVSSTDLNEGMATYAYQDQSDKDTSFVVNIPFQKAPINFTGLNNYPTQFKSLAEFQAGRAEIERIVKSIAITQ
jgi:hypothetical protein